MPKLDKHNPDDFDAVMATLSQREKLTAAWARNEWKNAPAHDTSMFPVHAHKGKADAPVRIVEFTDILCGHCAQFEEMLVRSFSLMPSTVSPGSDTRSNPGGGVNELCCVADRSLTRARRRAAPVRRTTPGERSASWAQTGGAPSVSSRERGAGRRAFAAPATRGRDGGGVRSV